jgi:hypothetical protein
MVDILAIGVMTGSGLTLIQSVFNSLAHTKLKPRVLVFKGLVPMLMSLSTVIILFSYTEWAWQHPSYVILMVCPLFSLVNSRQIVCNVTDQAMWTVPYSPLWFLVFPVNKVMALGYDEAYLALAVFLITLGWYMHFVLGTIG